MSIKHVVVTFAIVLASVAVIARVTPLRNVAGF